MKHNTQTVNSEIGHKQTTVYDEFVAGKESAEIHPLY